MSFPSDQAAEHFWDYAEEQFKVQSTGEAEPGEIHPFVTEDPWQEKSWINDCLVFGVIASGVGLFVLGLVMLINHFTRMLN